VSNSARAFQAFVRYAGRLLVPEVMRSMEQERVVPGGEDVSFAPAEVPLSYYLEIEDNGSDVTIFSFAGMAVLFAGMPKFEFRNLLQTSKKTYNFVFVRDPHRACYFQAPDGSNRGQEFFECIVSEAKAKLGSTYNVALGASGGGWEAFFLGCKLQFQQIIAFAPGFPPEVYLSIGSQLRTYFDLPKLVRHPSAYLEMVLVALGAKYVNRRVQRLGIVEFPDLLELYRQTDPKPRATIFYGTHCRPDRMTALHAAKEGIITRGIDSQRHNCAADLKARGLLGKSILEEIEIGLSQFNSKQEATARGERLSAI